MKKKFLSLMMAAAVVATTSVSAFAEEQGNVRDDAESSSPTIEAVSGGVINGEDNKEYTTDVTIKGDVADDEGKTKPGTLSVTVPTTATFAVSNKGELTGSKIKITNKGSQKIDVFAYKFKDRNGARGINIVGENTFDNITPEEMARIERNQISLKLTGNLNTAYFKSSDSDDDGIYSKEDLTGKVTKDMNYKIAYVPALGEEELTLSGKAGKKRDGINEAINEDFTLVLKIKKSVD